MFEVYIDHKFDRSWNTSLLIYGLTSQTPLYSIHCLNPNSMPFVKNAFIHIQKKSQMRNGKVKTPILILFNTFIDLIFENLVPI